MQFISNVVRIEIFLDPAEWFVPFCLSGWTKNRRIFQFYCKKYLSSAICHILRSCLTQILDQWHFQCSAIRRVQKIENIFIGILTRGELLQKTIQFNCCTNTNLLNWIIFHLYSNEMHVEHIQYLLQDTMVFFVAGFPR